jgi:hypothetical protein
MPAAYIIRHSNVTPVFDRLGDGIYYPLFNVWELVKWLLNKIASIIHG